MKCTRLFFLSLNNPFRGFTAYSRLNYILVDYFFDSLLLTIPSSVSQLFLMLVFVFQTLTNVQIRVCAPASAKTLTARTPPAHTGASANMALCPHAGKTCACVAELSKDPEDMPWCSSLSWCGSAERLKKNRASLWEKNSMQIWNVQNFLSPTGSFLKNITSH